MLRRRDMIGAIGGAVFSIPFAGGCSAQTTGEIFRPEDFGAKGDGVTNDSLAFAALADRVNRSGGGTVELRRTTYVVGMQRRGGGPGERAFVSVPLLEFRNLTRPLIVRGNGATIRCAPGLRYGSFDPRTGAPSRRPLPNYDQREIATPYGYMILAFGCSGRVEITDLELDGNMVRHVLGGLFGDMGRQIHSDGIGLYNNTGEEIVRNVHAHHHALDGLIIDGVDRARRVRSRIENVRSEYNARQGCSLVGGRGYDFVNCSFSHTGKGGLSSAPGAGLDIEGEDKLVRDVTATDCRFVDNGGPGVLADSGTAELASFTRCTFVGTTSWSAWPKKPLFRFSGCTFVGALSNAFADAERPERGTKFLDCLFRDDPSLSPTRQVYGDAVAELPSNPNVVFARCSFRLTHGSTLPWTNAVTYQDCTMSQRAQRLAYPRGRYVGRNVITGQVELHGSVIEGELVVNGRAMGRGRIG